MNYRPTEFEYQKAKLISTVTNTQDDHDTITSWSDLYSAADCEIMLLHRMINDLKDVKVMSNLYIVREEGCNVLKPEIPYAFRIKIEERDSKELGKMYDFLFDTLGCSWAGRIEHYAYADVNCEHNLSKRQDGYIYAIKNKWNNTHKISADAVCFKGQVDRGYEWPTLRWQDFEKGEDDE